MNAIAVADMRDVSSVVRDHASVMAVGARTKLPLIATRDDTVCLDMTALAGITEYDPAEFTFTALAGTRLRDVHTLLTEHGQYMPFDPPFVDAGATIGGTIAAGVSGSCRLRAGGVRDFIIGVRIVDGTGAHVRGGGRVVKNAAGFDIPRLMVGSMGRLGIICEATFKVFPAPLAWCTLRISCSDLTDAINCTADLAMKPFELEALDIEPPRTVVARVGGEPASLARHAERVGRSTNRRFEIMTGAGEASYWRDQREFSWHAQDHWLIRMPLRPDDVLALDARLDEAGLTRRYAVAANVAWFSWPGARHLDDLDPGGLHGQIVRGPPCPFGPLIGTGDFLAGAFGRRIIDALDPERRLPSFKAV